MRALQVFEHGQPPRLCEIEKPVAGPGQILLRIGACGVNFADLLMIKGTYQERPPLPFTLGLEVAGEVAAVGAGVTRFSVGDRVAVAGGGAGMADYGVYDGAQAVPLPDSMRVTEAAAFQIAYGTSHVALDHRARLQPGETLLVLGAAGGVGLTAVELGKLMGAKVIACARGADRLKACRAAGADHLIDSDTDDIRTAVKALGGADVVYDPVGGDQFNAALRACNPEARILVIGFASGEVPPVPANILMVKNISVLGVYWGAYRSFRPQVVRDSLATLLDWADKGRLTPHVSHAIPLERASEAFDLLRERRATGKVVITMED